MQDSNVDFALVGHNFFAYLLSLGLLGRGKNVMILDDDRFNYGDFFTNSLTSLDIELLKVWGEKHSLQPLINIENYLSPSSVHFFVGKKQIILGDSPNRNFRELARKFPKLFLSPKVSEGAFLYDNEFLAFDSLYLDFCRKISALIFNEKRSSKVSNLFAGSLPELFKGHFEFFFANFSHKNLLKDEDLYDFQAFIYMMRGFFQSRLSSTGSHSEMLHLFVSLISPYYKLDHERLIADLLQIHTQNGGEFKKLNLGDLKFHKGLVQSFELESFDGLVKPNKMAFIGGYPVGLPIKLGSTRALSYNCLNVVVEFSESLPELLKMKKCVFTSALKIGTERPFWEVNFGNDKQATFNLIMAKKEGTKVEFIAEKTKEILLSDLTFLFPEFDLKIASTQMKFTLDVFIEDKDYKAHERLEASLSKKIVDVIEDSAPLLMSRLKNVLYFGPYNEDSLGTFSSLIEMKKWKESL